MTLAKRLKDMGVVGAGGGGFPTHIKIANKCKLVIANGAECEPLLYNDKYLMENESEEILKGLELVMQSTGAQKGFIALKKKNLTASGKLKKLIAEKKNITLFLLDDYYPIGDEFILIQEITGKIVPEGRIPPDIGFLVNNVETLKNIACAEQGEAVTRRTLTCIGEVQKPSIVLAQIGTSFREIIDLCQPILSDFVVIAGGPMMGKIVFDLDTPVTKTTTGILVLARDHPLVLKKTLKIEYIVKQSKSACCQCSYCTELCPRYLLGHELYPHKIMRQISYGLDVPQDIIKNAFLCSECGLCEVFACPMELSPRVINQKIKENLVSARYQPEFSVKNEKIRDEQKNRKIPSSRIINRLRLNKYEENTRKVALRVVETDSSCVEILLKQHTGVPSHPIVKIGEMVNEGDLIAEIPPGKLGATLHASIKGKITFLDEQRIIIKK
ncbi:MAG: 4Fe-4S dicluster domain-containing protein [Candidatus Caldatribacteriota bacterium]